MGQVDDPVAEVRALQDRVSLLSEPSLRVDENLDFDTVLRGVMGSAQSLTGARYGMLLLYDDRGRVVDYIAFGVSREQAEEFLVMPDGMKFQKHLGSFSEPIRIRDFHSHLEERGLPEFNPPFPTNPVMPFLVAPIRSQGERFGAIYLGDKEGGSGQEFSSDDEDTMVMLASQVALVINNARGHREEQRTRAGLETLLNSVPVGVLVFDAETRMLTSANREVGRIVREVLMSDGSVQEMLDTATFWDSDGKQVTGRRLPMARAIETGKAVMAEDYVVKAPGGQTAAVLINATPVRSEDGKLDSLVLTVQDMSPQADLERLRTEFLGMVGHELRMPLTSVKGSAATLLAGISSLRRTEMVEFLRIIDEQADYMTGLIADLIDVVRIETGTLSVVPKPVEVAKVVDDARNTFLAAGGRDNVRISLPSDLPPVMAGGRRVVQVLCNLLTNASRNSHDESSIKVSAAVEGVHVAFSVADNGRGLTADLLPHLFTKFYRPQGQDQSADLGLGLAICKGIVEAHGGRIWAESDGPGLGSRFTFTIPAADPDAVVPTGDRAQDSKLAPPEADSGRMRVLALDDDPRTLKLVRDTLEPAGFEAIVTGDPGQLADLVEETDPHVLLLDMMLPNTDGIALMRDVLTGCDAPVIFLSAYDRSELIERAFEMGAVDYITKPFSPAELAARVRAALRKRPERKDSFVLGDLAIDYGNRSVSVAGRFIDLTPREYGVLCELASNAGAVLTQEQILQGVWGVDNYVDVSVLRTTIKNLRRKLGDNIVSPKYIYTVARVGYRMPQPDGSRDRA